MHARPVRRIESADNAAYRAMKKTLGARGVRKQGSVLVSGPKTVRDVMLGFPAQCEAWVSDGAEPPDELPSHAAWYRVSARLFRELDVFGTGSPLLLVRTPALGTWDPAGGLVPGCTVLVPFQDPENVGAVIRTAVAFDVTRVILLAEAAHPFHPRAIRASGGAVFRADLRRGPSIHDLPATLPVTALSAEGDDVARFRFPDSIALLPGLEGAGVPEHLRRGALAVPISSRVESLNAAAATAVVLYLWSRSRRAPR